MSRLKPFDWFMTINTAALVVSTVTTWWTNEWEFGLYAVAILTAGVLAWRFLRRFEYPVWLLVMVEIGIISHFAGGYVKYGEEGWLYWHYFLGVRYDKIVHFYNSMVGALGFGHLFRAAGLRLRGMEPFILIGFVLGAGALIEIIEYFAVLTIPNVGVGDYANNMEDLIMNLLGGVLGVVLATPARRRARAAVADGEV